MYSGDWVKISSEGGNIIVVMNSVGEEQRNSGVLKDGKIKVSLNFMDGGETEISYSEEDGQPHIYVFGAKMDKVN
ncbi:MAG: hypothetical protein IPH18_17680 [Chitinophagaceae bacterium]|nr:hypothetical protein [Chitinophagaceae bacterium]